MGQRARTLPVKGQSRTSILENTLGRDEDCDASDASLRGQFLEEKFQEAFGASLINDEGGPDSETRKIWKDATALRGKQYQLPGGNVGTRFVNILAEEMSSFSPPSSCSAKRWFGKQKIFDHF